jgi:hypothetical protein
MPSMVFTCVCKQDIVMTAGTTEEVVDVVFHLLVCNRCWFGLVQLGDRRTKQATSDSMRWELVTASSWSWRITELMAPVIWSAALISSLELVSDLKTISITYTGPYVYDDYRVDGSYALIDNFNFEFRISFWLEDYICNIDRAIHVWCLVPGASGFRVDSTSFSVLDSTIAFCHRPQSYCAEFIDLDLDGWGSSNSPDDLNDHPDLACQLSVF